MPTIEESEALAAQCLAGAAAIVLKGGEVLVDSAALEELIDCLDELVLETEAICQQLADCLALLEEEESPESRTSSQSNAKAIRAMRNTLKMVSSLAGSFRLVVAGSR